MKTIAKLEEKLSVLRAQLKNETDPEIAGDLNEEIDSIQDDIDELDESEYEQKSYEDALAQSDKYDQFRNEY